MNLWIIGLVTVMYAVDLIVTLINDRHSRQPIPAHAQGIYDSQRYAAWLEYSMATMRHEIVTKTVMVMILLILLLSGAFGALERWTNAWFDHPILQTLAFLGIFGLFSMMVHLPFRYYKTFVIEQKFGFNTTTRKTFFLDLLKGMWLAIGLGGPVVAFLHFLYLTFQERLWLFLISAWLTLGVLVILVVMLSTRVFIKLFNKLTPLPDGELKEAIQALAARVGFNVRAISVMDASKRSTKLNAFFSGLGRTREVVLFDTLLEKLDQDEILAVLAHELGHAVHRDVPRMLTLQIALFGLYVGLIGLILQTPELGQAFGSSGVHFGFSLVLFNILAGPLDLILSIPINALSRKAEYVADAFAARMAGVLPTLGALRKLAQENLANLNPHPLYVLLHYTHPPIPERLRAVSGQAT